MYNNEIKNLCLKYKKISEFNKCKKEEFLNFKKQLFLNTEFLNFKNPKLTERIYCIINNIEYLKICPICEKNKILRFLNINKGYHDICNDKKCIKFKTENTNLTKYGSKQLFSSSEIKQKIKQTNIETWGFENPMLNEINKEKIRNNENNKSTRFGTKKHKDAMFKKYGDKNYNSILGKKAIEEKYGSSKNLMISLMPKIAQTQLEKYGNERVSKLHWKDLEKKKQMLEKKNETLIKKYGINYISILQEKKDKNNLLKYGVSNVAQIPEIHDKINNNSFKYKKYITKNGNIIKLQGYEAYVYDNLLDFLNEEDIIIDRIKIPKIEYYFNGKKKIYFPDFYIPKLNLIIESKSTWTITQNIQKQKLKYEAVKRLGFDFALEIVQKDFKLNYLKKL